MSNIKQLKANNSNIYPITHEDAVLDENGTAISEKYATKDYVNSQVNAVSSSLEEIHNNSVYAANAMGDLSQLQTSDKSSIVAAINEAFQYGNSVKQSLVDALIAKEVNVSTSNSISQLVAKIADIEQGGGDVDFTIPGLPPWHTGAQVATENFWATGTNMTQARQGAAAAAIGTDIYVCGGCANASVSYNTTFVNTNYCYNTKTNQWTSPKAAMSGNKYEHAAAVANGKLYAIAGYSARNTADNKVFCYDPNANSWTTVTNYPVSCHSLAATTVNNKIYVCGGATLTTSGYTTTSTAINSHYCYDPLLDSWTELQAMPAAQYQHASVGYGNQVYVMGGYKANINYCYDIASNAWTNKTVIPSATADHSLSVIKNKIYLVGGGTGTNTTTVSQTVRVFDPAASTNQWSTKTNVTQTVMNHVGVNVRNNIFVIGGKSGNTVRNNTYCYVPESNK